MTMARDRNDIIHNNNTKEVNFVRMLYGVVSETTGPIYKILTLKESGVL